IGMMVLLALFLEQQHLGASIVRFDGCTSSRAPKADYDDIRLVLCLSDHPCVIDASIHLRLHRYRWTPQRRPPPAFPDAVASARSACSYERASAALPTEHKLRTKPMSRYSGACGQGWKPVPTSTRASPCPGLGQIVETKRKPLFHRQNVNCP